MTITTETAIATCFVGLVGWVAVGIEPEPFVVPGGRGGGGAWFGFDPDGTSGKKGSSCSTPELSAGGGGAANDDEESSSPGGGVELSGKSGWWSILLRFSGIKGNE